MNIIEAEDMIKGVPDQILLQYAQDPPPNIPQFLAISEVQRRQDMRQRFQAQQQSPQPTIKDQVLQGGIASAGGPPPMGAMPPGAPMQQMPPGAPMQQMPQGAPAQQMSPPPMQQAAGGAPMRMSMGGIVPYRMSGGREVPGSPDPYRLENLNAAQRLALEQIAKNEDAQVQNVLRNSELFNQAPIEKRARLLRNLDAMPGFKTPSAPVNVEALNAERYANLNNQSNADAAANLDRQLAATAPQIEPGIPAAGAAIGATPAVQPRGGPNVRSMISELSKPTELSQQQKDFVSLIEAQRAQGLPGQIDLEPYRQAAIQRQKEANDEARRMAISGTLTSLGAGIMAGDPAAGLNQATQVAMGTLREGRREAAAEGRSAEQLQLQSAQQKRQESMDKMKFDRETVGEIANIYGEVAKSDAERREKAIQIFANYDAVIQRNLADASQQGSLDNRAFLNALTESEKMIQESLDKEDGLTFAQKSVIRDQLVERAIRKYAVMFPNVDVGKILEAQNKQPTTGTPTNVPAAGAANAPAARPPLYDPKYQIK